LGGKILRLKNREIIFGTGQLFICAFSVAIIHNKGRTGDSQYRP